MTFAAAAEITFGKRWLAVLASLIANAFPLSRDTAIRQSLERVGTLLDRGWNVGIFPEGIQLLNRELQPFQSGTGMLAIECQTSVVPVRLVNHGRTKSGFLGWHGRTGVTVRFGEPLDFPRGTSYAEATERIERAVREL
jgi:1-acyl-sn-glycerol-3-phosphate acyltransferase